MPALCHGQIAVDVAQREAKRISLAGSWRFALDPEGVGEAEEWYTRELADTLDLPGTLAQNKKGDRSDPWENVQELSTEYSYQGIAWYQRTIEIPATWQGCRSELVLERSKLTKAWVDNVCLGEQNALGVAQSYMLPSLSAGSHTLTIRVDNKSRPPGDGGGHMITTSTQSNWNGLIGSLHLKALDPLQVCQTRVVADIQRMTATVALSLVNSTGNELAGNLTLAATPFNVAEAQGRKPISVVQAFTAAPGETAVSVILPMGPDALLWSEFSPALYRLAVFVQTESGRYRDVYRDEFGMREFKTKDGQFTINGRPVLLRGKHDALVFPLLAHVAMELDEWMRVLTIAKSYGINHYRFHSCTPPKAAFMAADRVGIYMQPELYNFGGAYRDGAAGDYNLAEGMRILNAYGNHPSFVMFALGNEIWEGRDQRAKAVAAFREFDPTRLYAQGSNNEFGRPTLAEGDDYWTTARTQMDSAVHAVRGSFSHADKPLGHIQRLRPSTTYDYREAVRDVPVPVIGHETGQFQVFPRFGEIPKYTGVQKAWNLDVFRRRLEGAGMLDQADDFVAASGALAVLGYREEIEACLRTPHFGGFQLLDLQDFPGQGTALVGILDAFMHSKGLVLPDRWRDFCGPVVPLARMKSYTWTQNETFEADIEIAQYGPVDMSQTTLAWELSDDEGLVVAHGTLPPKDLPQGALISCGTVEISLAAIHAPARYTLRLRLEETEYQNQYPLWIYPESVEVATPDSVAIRETWDADTKALLAAGKTVLLLPRPDDFPGVEGFFTTDFWCYPMFRSICEGNKKTVAPGTLGLLIDANHPALADFPTENHTDWQWWDLVMGSRAAILDATDDAYRPIVQSIDNFERNHRLGVLFEAKVGRGRLLVCTLDLLHKQDSPVARQLFHSLLDYARSGVATDAILSIKTLDKVFAFEGESPENGSRESFSEFYDRKD